MPSRFLFCPCFSPVYVCVKLGLDLDLGLKARARARVRVRVRVKVRVKGTVRIIEGDRGSARVRDTGSCRGLIRFQVHTQVYA